MNSISPLTLLNPKKLKVLLSLGFKGYLVDKGWFNAYAAKSAIDSEGTPLAWVTYSFIDFIKERVNKHHDIFEFGSGNSTLFYAKLARSVHSVEHDRAWFEKCKNINLPNVTIMYSDLQPGGDYCKAAAAVGKKFHIIIVDGRDRVNCCKQAIHALDDTGVIVLDDSEREKYTEAHAFLKQQGFKHIPFTGMAPGVITSKCTSVFYKSSNCLSI